MIENNRIIIIDDNEDDLKKLSKVFHDHGIGCKSFIYDGFNFPTPMLGVRFAFFDIHLNQDSNVNSTLKDAISHYISVDNGPFVLIFWSSNTNKIEDFIEFVNRTNDEFKNKLKPILLEAIDKSEFIEKNNRLEEKLDSILSKDIAQCLIKFDEEILIAARQTLDNLLQIIPYGNKWGDATEFNENCKKVFSKIAEASYGLTRAKANPDAAIRECILPILENILSHNSQIYWKEYLTPLQNACKSNELKFPSNFSTATLNSVFHVTTCVEQCTKEERGAVCCIIKEKRENIFNTLFKISFEEWLRIIVKNPDEELQNNTKIVGIEISASCDFSQDKKRTKKYILGAIIPVSTQINKNTPDYVYQPPAIKYNDQEYIILVNFNYTFVESNENQFLDSPLFVLRKEMMDLIGNKYANHISRIGITSFR